jgi:hypothetical protein
LVSVKWIGKHQLQDNGKISECPEIVHASGNTVR